MDTLEAAFELYGAVRFMIATQAAGAHSRRVALAESAVGADPQRRFGGCRQIARPPDGGLLSPTRVDADPSTKVPCALIDIDSARQATRPLKRLVGALSRARRDAARPPGVRQGLERAAWVRTCSTPTGRPGRSSTFRPCVGTCRNSATIRWRRWRRRSATSCAKPRHHVVPRLARTVPRPRPLLQADHPARTWRTRSFRRVMRATDSRTSGTIGLSGVEPFDRLGPDCVESTRSVGRQRAAEKEVRMSNGKKGGMGGKTEGRGKEEGPARNARQAAHGPAPVELARASDRPVAVISREGVGSTPPPSSARRRAPATKPRRPHP